MPIQKLTRRTRNFGWGYSFTPTGEDAYSIQPPAAPDYTGTVRQVLKARRADRTFNAHRDTAFHSQRFFLAGQPIVRDHKFEMDLDSLLEGSVDEIDVQAMDK